MIKLGLFASITAIIATLAIATSSPVEAGDACVHKDLKTKLVKAACEKGGQAAAKEQMQAFNKEKGIGSCNKCHSSLKPNYDLKPDGMEQFKKLDGDNSKTAKAFFGQK